MKSKACLRILIGIQDETADILAKYICDFEVIIVDDIVELQTYFAKKASKVHTAEYAERMVFSSNNEECSENGLANSLLIAATDETIAIGKQYGIATMAYLNPDIPNQTYAGVDMIVEGFEEVDTNFLEKVWQRFHHLPWKIAETPRCIIRELSLDDLDALFKLYADEEITKYTENLYPYEEEKEFQIAYINNMYRFYGYGMWLVFSKETGELIGRAGLEHREYNGEIELELGYVIGTKFQRQGYASEVCQQIIEIAKVMTDFPRINCLIEENNIPSIRLAEKLQFALVEDLEIDGKRMCRYIKPLSVS